MSDKLSIFDPGAPDVAGAGWSLSAQVMEGRGEAHRFTELSWVRQWLRTDFGIEPFPGTLNLALVSREARVAWQSVRHQASRWLSPSVDGFCRARGIPARLAGSVPVVAVVPEVPGYPEDQIEVIAPLGLRQHLGLREGDALEVGSGSLAGVRAVLFDVDGTLVDSIAGMHLAVSRAAAVYGFNVPPAAVRRALNFGESLWDQVIPPAHQGDPELPAVLRMETMRHWPRVLEESVAVFPGLAETLGRLRDGGVKLGICTGSRGESFLPLRRAGLLDYFSPVVTAADVSRPKPDPEGLLKALAQIGCAPDEAVYVGDTRDDVMASRAAGMRAIGVLTGAADSGSLAEAGAHRLVGGHHALARIILEAA